MRFLRVCDCICWRTRTSCSSANWALPWISCSSWCSFSLGIDIVSCFVCDIDCVCAPLLLPDPQSHVTRRGTKLEAPRVDASRCTTAIVDWYDDRARWIRISRVPAPACACAECRSCGWTGHLVRAKVSCSGRLIATGRLVPYHCSYTAIPLDSRSTEWLTA